MSDAPDFPYAAALKVSRLAEIAADQALIYRPVGNSQWFAERIAEHRAAGEYHLADKALAIAREHGIEVLGERPAVVIPRINFLVEQSK